MLKKQNLPIIIVTETGHEFEVWGKHIKDMDPTLRPHTTILGPKGKDDNYSGFSDIENKSNLWIVSKSVLSGGLAADYNKQFKQMLKLKKTEEFQDLKLEDNEDNLITNKYFLEGQNSNEEKIHCLQLMWNAVPNILSFCDTSSSKVSTYIKTANKLTQNIMEALGNQDFMVHDRTQYPEKDMNLIVGFWEALERKEVVKRHINCIWDYAGSLINILQQIKKTYGNQHQNSTIIIDYLISRVKFYSTNIKHPEFPTEVQKVIIDEDSGALLNLLPILLRTQGNVLVSATANLNMESHQTTHNTDPTPGLVKALFCNAKVNKVMMPWHQIPERTKCCGTVHIMSDDEVIVQLMLSSYNFLSQVAEIKTPLRDINNNWFHSKIDRPFTSKELENPESLLPKKIGIRSYSTLDSAINDERQHGSYYPLPCCVAFVAQYNMSGEIILGTSVKTILDADRALPDMRKILTQALLPLIDKALLKYSKADKLYDQIATNIIHELKSQRPEQNKKPIIRSKQIVDFFAINNPKIHLERITALLPEGTLININNIGDSIELEVKKFNLVQENMLVYSYIFELMDKTQSPQGRIVIVSSPTLAPLEFYFENALGEEKTPITQLTINRPMISVFSEPNHKKVVHEFIKILCVAKKFRNRQLNPASFTPFQLQTDRNINKHLPTRGAQQRVFVFAQDSTYSTLHFAVHCQAFHHFKLIEKLFAKQSSSLSNQLVDLDKLFKALPKDESSKSCIELSLRLGACTKTINNIIKGFLTYDGEINPEQSVTGSRATLEDCAENNIPGTRIHLVGGKGKYAKIDNIMQGVNLHDSYGTIKICLSEKFTVQQLVQMIGRCIRGRSRSHLVLEFDDLFNADKLTGCKKYKHPYAKKENYISNSLRIFEQLKSANNYKKGNIGWVFYPGSRFNDLMIKAIKDQNHDTFLEVFNDAVECQSLLKNLGNCLDKNCNEETFLKIESLKLSLIDKGLSIEEIKSVFVDLPVNIITDIKPTSDYDEMQVEHSTQHSIRFKDLRLPNVTGQQCFFNAFVQHLFHTLNDNPQEWAPLQQQDGESMLHLNNRQKSLDKLKELKLANPQNRQEKLKEFCDILRSFKLYSSFLVGSGAPHGDAGEPLIVAHEQLPELFRDSEFKIGTSITKSSGDRKVTYKIDAKNYTTLNLPIPNTEKSITLQTIFETFFAEEALEREEWLKAGDHFKELEIADPGVCVKTEKTLTLEGSLPNRLTIKLNRIETKVIDCPEKHRALFEPLDIGAICSQYVEESCSRAIKINATQIYITKKNNAKITNTDQVRVGNKTYDLESAVLHNGIVDCGHTTYLAKTKNESQTTMWLLKDDNEIAEHNEKSKDWHTLIEEGGYIFTYVLQPPKPLPTQ